MTLRWEHHLVGVWHPGVLAAVVAASIVAWYIGALTTRLVLRVGDPWRRAVYLPLPVAVISLFIFFLPLLLFHAGWIVTHSRYVQADLFAARLVMVVPLVVAFISSIRQLARVRAAKGPGRAVG